MTAEEQFLAHGDGRGVDLLRETIGGEDFELGGILQHDGHAIAPDDVDAAIRADRRGVNAGRTFKPLGVKESLPGLCIKAGENGVVVRVEVEAFAVEQRRGHVGRALAMLPRDGVGARDVAGGAELDRLQGGAAEAADRIDHPETSDRAGNDVARHAAAFPDLFAGGQIVAACPLRCRDDHLRLAVVLQDERRGPGRLLIAGIAPKFLAGVLVERDDEVLALVIPVHHDGASEKCRRSALAETVAGLHPSKILLPFQIARQIVAMQSARTEPGEDQLSVGDGRMRGVAVIAMMPLVRDDFARDLLPLGLAGVTVDGEQGELISFRRLL